MSSEAGAPAEGAEGGEQGGTTARFYPNCDARVWLRSCEREVEEPMEGMLSGVIPDWLDGCLLRNGPGSLKVGQDKFEHLFDSSALLHRFRVRGGRATYQCRFLRSSTWQRNRRADRIVVTEFGTRAAPDPCRSIFDRVSSLFRPGEGLSDNAMISLYPFGDQIYAFTESPVIHRIDPASLATLERRNVADHVAIVNHTSHPHVDRNGDVYNVGLSLAGGAPHYAVVRFPRASATAAASADQGAMFARAVVVGRVRARWPLHPAYMHSFGITENYFVLVEQPLAVSLCGVVRGALRADPLISCLRWYPDHKTHIVLISRSTGVEARRYSTDTLFFLHLINQFERDGTVLVDLCSYKDASVLQAMYVRSMESMQSNASYAEMFRSRAVRLRLPLRAGAGGGGGARVPHVSPEPLCRLGCETPRINYEACCGRPYRYFYSISTDVDAPNPGLLIKVDTASGELKTWCEDNCYPSEPIFVARPDSQAEDDGVVLSALVWGGRRERQVAMLVLDAASMAELGRAVFHTPSPAPKCLHGWFLRST